MARTMTVSDSVVVAADPVAIWTQIADPTQMPRWSPENTGARVKDEPRPLTVGETFVGRNTRRWLRWQTRCTVTASDPGERFEFRVDHWGVFRPLIRIDVATWSYTFDATPGGTLVTETWADARTAWPQWMARILDRLVTFGTTFADFQVQNIATTLAALQADFAGHPASR